jgi:hypothetical protein
VTRPSSSSRTTTYRSSSTDESLAWNARESRTDHLVPTTSASLPSETLVGPAPRILVEPGERPALALRPHRRPRRVPPGLRGPDDRDGPRRLAQRGCSGTASTS